MASAVEIRHLSKRFRLYHEKYTSLKERILHAGRIPHHDFWALHDIDIDIAQGDTLGILGRNGCGKSTLLKCIAGILTPTKGEIRVRGHVAAMLELGAGFQPELSGRENVFLNASLLGLSRREIEKKFDEIVDFAEIEEFIDNQVRFYSSGMYVRLGFAVAVSVAPDVLLVDEVLAVGDERFQQKCVGRIHEFQAEGRTIVFVSHAPDTMRNLCNKVAVIEAGELVAVNPPGEAISAFRDILLHLEESPELLAGDETEAGTGPSTIPVKIAGSRLESSGGSDGRLLPGESASVVIELELGASLERAAFGCSIFSREGTLVLDWSSSDSFRVPIGRSTVRFAFKSLPLLDGSYTVNVRVEEPGGGTVYARLEPAATLVFAHEGSSTGIVDLPVGVEVAPA